jgi:hypothetical protein
MVYGEDTIEIFMSQRQKICNFEKKILFKINFQETLTQAYGGFEFGICGSPARCYMYI